MTTDTTTRTRSVLPVLIALATAGLLAAAPATADRETETVVETFELPAGAEVSVANTNGSIRISSWDGSEVRVEAHKEARAGSRSSALELLEDLRIVFEETPTGLDIRADRPDRGWFDWLTGKDTSVEYDIQLPAGLSTRARTVNGNVTIEGIAAATEAKSTNGRISVVDGAGALKARTTNGSVKAELVALGGDIELRSTNGSIRLTLPEGASASIVAKTTNGSVRTRAPIAVEETNRRGNRVSGTLGDGGGPLIEVRTVNGSIRLDS